ncbi:MAG: hypothetical protein ACUVQ8_06640 [Nitrososphaeria archaeon]
MSLREIRTSFRVRRTLCGSFTKKELNEESDLDMMLVGDFKGKMHKRAQHILRDRTVMLH